MVFPFIIRLRLEIILAFEPFLNVSDVSKAEIPQYSQWAVAMADRGFKEEKKLIQLCVRYEIEISNETRDS